MEQVSGEVSVMKRVIRIIMTVSLMTVLVAVTAGSVFASGGNVTYKGHADKFIFEPRSSYSPTDLFDENTKGIMPGDSITETINIKNDSAVTVKIYMKSLGAADGAFATKEESAEFLSKLTLTAGGEKATADIGGGYSEWKLLGTFEKGANKDLDIVLNVPIDLDNASMDKIGYIRWQFAVEEVGGTTPEKPDDDSGAKTGDYVRLWLPIILGAAACLAVIIIIARRKKD